MVERFNSLYDLVFRVRRMEGQAFAFVEFRSDSVPPADSTVLTTDSRMSADDEMAFLERECRAFHLLGVPVGASLAVGVGRSRDCEVRIDDGSVSARHCTLYLDAATGQMQVVDHGSKNGTFVDGRRAEVELRMPARSGSVVRLGQVSSIVLDPAAIARLAQAA
jgi:hypothetical protein